MTAPSKSSGTIWSRYKVRLDFMTKLCGSVPTTPASTPAPAPLAKLATPATPATQDSLELPTPVRLPAGAISATQWAEVIAFIDSNLDLGTLKHDWKMEYKIDNVIRLTEGGKQQQLLDYMRARAGAAFPF